MTPHTAYPRASELQAFLTSAGVYDPSYRLDLDSAIATAIDAWGDKTGYKPFLNTGGAATARRYRPPSGPDGAGRLLTLGAGLLSVSSLTVDGETLTLDCDFWLEPTNAPADGEPYDLIRFCRPPFCCPNNPESIVVTGQWGYSTTLPDRAWSAILGRAAIEVAPLIALQISEGLVVKKTLEEQEHYLNSQSQSPLTVAAAGWQQTFNSAAKRYKLRTL